MEIHNELCTDMNELLIESVINPHYSYQIMNFHNSILLLHNSIMDLHQTNMELHDSTYGS